MKKLLAFLIAVTLIAACAPVWAEEAETWDCPNCGATGNTRSFCPECGAPRPGTEAADPDAITVHTGDLITFGTWEQDNNKGNGAEPIEWLVLEIRGGRALALSRYGLVHTSYAANNHKQTWANSALRTALNGDFFGTAFTDAEKAAIFVTEVDESAEQQDPDHPSVRTGDNTRDRIFALSYAEIVKYLPTAEERKCYCTEYIRRHANFSETLYSEGRTCWYWLRSPAFTNNAGAVDWDGTIDTCYISHPYGVGRPCCWVDLAALGYTAAEDTAAEDASAEAAPEPDAAAVYAGDRVIFGRYEQDNDTANGPEPIDWLVLRVDEEAGRALLLARCGLDTRRFHDKGGRVNWVDCSLRTWLNADFLEAAFSPEEQAAIPLTHVDNSGAQARPERPLASDDTEDRLFLLSYAEYMADVGTRDIRVCAPTDYALAQGAFYSRDGDETDGRAAGRWWLRSSGEERYYTMMISPAGVLNTYMYANETGICVRPALWVELSALRTAGE